MIVAQTRAASRSLMVLLLAGASLAACATPQPRYASRLPSGEIGRGPAAPAPQGGGRYKVGDPYQVAGIWYVPHEQPDYDETGTASWYGDAFDQKPTANGEIFDMRAVSGAHTTLPLPSIVEVTNLDNGRKLKVRVNDRGPFVGGRIIDLSHAAAQELGYDQAGLAHVRVRYVGPAPLDATNPPLRYAANTPPARNWQASQPRYPTQSAPAQAYASQTYAPPATTHAYPAPAAISSTPLPPAPVAVTSAALPPVTGSAIAPGGSVHGPNPVTAATSPYPAPSVAPTALYRVQAGAFSDRDNARKVMNSLRSAGAPQIEPMERDGEMIYRVVLPGGASEAEAVAVRDQVASLGYAEARVLRPY
jgi:rare lipoprotein A